MPFLTGTNPLRQALPSICLCCRNLRTLQISRRTHCDHSTTGARRYMACHSGGSDQELYPSSMKLWTDTIESRPSSESQKCNLDLMNSGHVCSADQDMVANLACNSLLLSHRFCSQVRQDCLPPEVPANVAASILFIGKSVRVLQPARDAWLEDPLGAAPALQRLEDMPAFDSGQLALEVEAARGQVCLTYQTQESLL